MIHRIVVAMAAAVLLTGCGGGSDTSKSKPTPTPRSYTIEQLAAALPAKEDVAGASGVGSSCPKDKDLCPAMKEGEYVSIDLTLSPVGGKAAEMDKAGQESLFGNSVSVSAWKHTSSSISKQRISDFKDTNQKFDGSYDIKQAGDPKTGATPGEKGEGSLSKLESGLWKGYFAARHGSMTFQDESESRLIATAGVGQGDVTVDVYVNVESDGRPADYAEKLARKALADYLKRLS